MLVKRAKFNKTKIVSAKLYQIQRGRPDLKNTAVRRKSTPKRESKTNP